MYIHFSQQWWANPILSPCFENMHRFNRVVNPRWFEQTFRVPDWRLLLWNGRRECHLLCQIIDDDNQPFSIIGKCWRLVFIRLGLQTTSKRQECFRVNGFVRFEQMTTLGQWTANHFACMTAFYRITQYLNKYFTVFGLIIWILYLKREWQHLSD